MKNITKRFLVATLTLVLTGGLCMSVTGTQAQELDGDMPFKFVVVLQGQSSGSIDTTATTPFDMNSVGILSIGNQTLTASLNMTSEQTGLWWIGIIGLGTVADADFVFGIAPLPGQTARISVDPGIAFALATGGVFSVAPVSEEEPMFYNIAVNGG
mgnify:CR=1 FL=1|jgi:hypothetical protein